jgi:hypothetical protein
MPRWIVIGAPILILLAAACSGSPPPPKVPQVVITPIAGTPTPGLSVVPWSVGPIQAQFNPACFCTTYSIDILSPDRITFTNDWQVVWKLKLTLVDQAGAPDPSTPGSAAGVDGACDNAGLGTANPVTDHVSLTFKTQNGKDVQGGTDAFVWHHPDPTSTPPGYQAGYFHCNHLLQGPLGHQGAISVTITHGTQKCTDSYFGSHSGLSTDKNQPAAPACFKS